MSRLSGGLLLLLLACAAAEAPEALKPIELKGPSFVAQLKELPETRWTLVEFYAHWCPTCRHFQPEYEKIAAYFHGRGELEPRVSVARLDCADYSDMCGKFDVRGYPTMMLGRASQFVALDADKLTAVKTGSRTLEGVAEAVGAALGTKFEGVGAGGAGASGGGAAAERSHLQILQPAPARADLVDIEGATVKSWEYLAGSPVLTQGMEARQALKDWLHLLTMSHPVPRCQEGAARLQARFDELWPAEEDQPKQELSKLQLCPGTTFADWRGCKGLKPDTRGYTCGLWQLFHALASRLPEEHNAGAAWLASVKGFVKHYFQCADCSKHFVKYAGGEAAAAVSSKRDAVLWVWRAHNLVNVRLGKNEAANPSIGDPNHPHILWPPRLLCPRCRRGGLGGEVEWEDAEVVRFLAEYYGHADVHKPHPKGGLNPATGWPQAGLLVATVFAAVHLALRGSRQYRLKRSRSAYLPT